GGALAAAANLPLAEAEPLLSLARGAFSQSLVVTSLVGVVIALVSAACAFVLLRRARHGAHGD
ncbi:MAG: hypothetical protein Q7T73_21450, partial [Beijerinckiaceae bacterium]|nr:hypothetical protein [Beijerinckiaceae bacterium]